MRRAAVQAFRSARRPCLRKLARSRPASFAVSSHGLAIRQFSSQRRASSAILTSSMQLRSITGALVAAAVASGAFYALRGSSLSGSSPAAEQARSFSASPQSAETTRRALIVSQGSLYTGTITGDGPVAKETDDSGRKVLEMLTPEQATAKLRKNEESWLVGRGQGVVRYDVVQIPSNDPIEDDHAEKIIEVPQSVATTEEGAAASDWMFWGVFDGHRSVCQSSENTRADRWQWLGHISEATTDAHLVCGSRVERNLQGRTR
jgi:pyruvate dehydrogenase phosphatase